MTQSNDVAVDRMGEIASALESCDWSGTPIGNKAIILLAIGALRLAHQPPAACEADEIIRARAIAIVVKEADEMGYCDEDIAEFRSGKFDGDDLLTLQAVERALSSAPVAPVGEVSEIDIDLLDADMRLEGKIANATGALADTDWKPSRSHIEGMRNTMEDALDSIRKARTALQNDGGEG
jgi:hypothetical protein